MPGKPNAETFRALDESLLATLEDLAHLTPNSRILKAAAPVGDFWQIIGPVWPGTGGDHLIGIGVDDEVGVVGNDYHLTACPSFAKALDELVENRLGIEVLLGLVDDQWPVVVEVDREIEKQ